MGDRAKAIFRAFLRDWASIVGIALILALFGPYETFAVMPPSIRVVFWLVAALGTALLVKAARKLLQIWRLTKHWPIVALRLAAAVLGSVPAALLMSQLYAALTYAHRADFGLAYMYVLLPTAFFTLLLSSRHLPWWALQDHRLAAAVEPNDPPPANKAAAFLARNVSRFANGSLLALEAEDHYLRVHTDGGSELILMRLRDAIAQLGDTPGLQVHRSFWVATAAVGDVTRRGAQAQLRLSNGLAVPVSRTYMAALREAGWFDGRFAQSGVGASATAAARKTPL